LLSFVPGSTARYPAVDLENGYSNPYETLTDLFGASQFFPDVLCETLLDLFGTNPVEHDCVRLVVDDRFELVEIRLL